MTCPPASTFSPTLGVAVIAVEIGVPVTDIDPWEATRVSLLAAVDAVGRGLTVLAGTLDVQELALEFGVGFAESDGTWDDGVRRALAISPAGLVALAQHDTVVVATRLQAAASTLSVDDAWICGSVWGGPTGAPRGDGWIGPGSVVRTSVALAAMHEGDAASAAWTMRAAGWSCRSASGPVMAAQGDVPPAVAQRVAVRAGAAVLRATLRRSSPLWHAGCERSVRVSAATAACRLVLGLVTALLVGLVAAAVAWGRVPAATPWQAVVLLVSSSLVVASGAASIDTSVRTVGRALAGGAASHHRRFRLRVGRLALLDRPVAVALTLVVEVALVVRAGLLQVVPGRTAAEQRGDVVALAVGVAVLVPLLVSLRVIIRARPRRSSTRLQVSLPVRIDGRAGTVVDLGARGMAVRLDAAPMVGACVTVALGQPGAELCVPAVVARVGATGESGTGNVVLGLRVVVSPATDDTMAFQRMWVEHTAGAVRERSLWAPADQVTSRQATGPIRVMTAVAAVVVAFAFAPPFPASAAASGRDVPGTRSAPP
ncbi:MAG: hypothetical protein WEB78_05410, partial [Ilumatobacteraceae bacterium]